MEPNPRSRPLHPQVGIGHIHLKVSDLERALAFYRDTLGFELTQRYGSQAAFLSAGDYHHHIGLNTWESSGGSPPPPGTTGLYHLAILYPTRAELADALRRLVEAGIPRDRIWSSQGLMAPHGGAMPFAVAVDSPVKNFDSGGMSVEGAKPKDGHLGAILYGASAVNDIPMENGRSLFATLAGIDPRFAVVEFNTADLINPQVLPTYAAGYRALRDLWNAGARYVSPMAWNGSNGVNAGKPGYVTFTAWRNTPLEEAARDFMLARAGLPLGALLWTFGTPTHADGDGWTAETGSVALAPGTLLLTSDANGRAAIVSPRGLALTPERIGKIVAGLPQDMPAASFTVYARTAGGSVWTLVADAQGAGLANIAAGRMATRNRAAPAAPADQLKVEFDFGGPVSRTPLTRIAVLPATASR